MRIAVLDDSGPNRDFVCNVVRASGHGVAEFRRPEQLVQALEARDKFDIVVAAFRGDQDTALSSARYLRRIAGMSVPVLLMLRPEQLQNAKTFAMDPAIDFIMVPCKECEMLARISAVTTHKARVLDASMRLVFGQYQFDPRFGRVSFHGEHARLKPREFDLALFLFQNAGFACSRESLYRAIWPEGGGNIDGRTLDVHILRIRQKLKLTANDRSRVQLSTLRGFGYLLTFGEGEKT